MIHRNGDDTFEAVSDSEFKLREEYEYDHNKAIEYGYEDAPAEDAPPVPELPPNNRFGKARRRAAAKAVKRLQKEMKALEEKRAQHPLKPTIFQSALTSLLRSPLVFLFFLHLSRVSQTGAHLPKRLLSFRRPKSPSPRMCEHCRLNGSASRTCMR